MTPYSFPGADYLDQRRYRRKIYRDRKVAYATRFMRITEAIEVCTGYSIKELQSEDRDKPLPFLRAIVAGELYDPKFVSFKQIGRDLHRDHTTIIYYIRELLPSLEDNQEFILLKQNIKKYF
jgi:chromosomal replication initiation ATPase DnaA